MKKVIAAYLVAILPLVAHAQRKSDKPSSTVEESKIFAYGVTTNTNSGLLGGFVFRHSNIIQVREGKTIHRYAALELVNIKDPKESNIPTGAGNRVAYGKKNYLFAIRPEYGREWFMFKKNGEEGVGMSVILAGGPTIGIQKPYYIRYIEPNADSPIVVAYDPNIHIRENIIGPAGFWQGLFTNAKVIPGLHAKTALNLDMNTFSDNITGFEFGFTFDYFLKSPEILAKEYVASKPFFAAGYLTLYFGNKRMKK